MSGEPEVLYPEGLRYAECVERLADEFRARSIAPLLGAGISLPAPAHLPIADKLLRPLLEIICLAVAPSLARFPEGSVEREAILTQINTSRLERVLDAFHRIYGEPAMDWLGWLESENCNNNHLALAALVGVGALPNIITLNFDTLIEEAIKRGNLRCLTRCTLHPVSFETGRGPVRCVVTKPHGSLFPEPSTRYRYLGATLAQVGSHVSTLTMQAFKEIFRAQPALLVGGYSDNDWDIMPALMSVDTGVRRLIWVQHSSAPPDRAMEWIRRLDSSGTGRSAIAIKGNFTRLLHDCLLRIGVAPPTPAESRHDPITRDARQLFDDPVRNTLVFAYLLHDDELKQHFLDKLGVQADAHEEALRLSGLASIAHTRRNVAHALRLNRRAFRLVARTETNSSDELAERLIWLGYQHLCLCKRLRWRRPLGAIVAPWHLLCGLILLQRGVSPGGRGASSRRKALAVFYWTDLVHSWANVLILGGRRRVERFQGIFAWLGRRYDRVEKLSPDLMAGEYYWLRKLEVRLLSGETIDTMKERAMLDEILASYSQIQNSVQMGNPHVYLALVEFLHGAGVAEATKHLNAAHELWSRPGNVTPAGLERVAIFRRFCEIPAQAVSSLAPRSPRGERAPPAVGRVR